MIVKDRAAAGEAGKLLIRPLQPTIGAEIHGVDLSRPLLDETRDQIRAAVLKHKVVFFHDQDLDDTQHAAFAARFGPLYAHPINRNHDDLGHMNRIAAADFRGVKIGRDPGSIQDGYHADTSWRLVPAWGAVLRAVSLPEVGGDTIWVDGHLAYQGLSDELKARLEGLHVTHDFRRALARAGQDYPIVAHPIVRTHRQTGEKILWVNFLEASYVVGLDPAESRELLSAILFQYKQPANQMRFSWRPGAVAFWDNVATVHYAVSNYGDFPRVLHRVLIEDERPAYADL